MKTEAGRMSWKTLSLLLRPGNLQGGSIFVAKAFLKLWSLYVGVLGGGCRSLGVQFNGKGAVPWRLWWA